MRGKTIFCKTNFCKAIFQTCLAVVLLLVALFPLAGCADDKEQAELASHHWETVAVSQEEFRLPDDYTNQDKLYLFVSRDMLESHYDLSQVTLNDKPITLVDSSFNVPGPGAKALFLVGTFDVSDASNPCVLKVPGMTKTNDIAIGYKVK